MNCVTPATDPVWMPTEDMTCHTAIIHTVNNKKAFRALFTQLGVQNQFPFFLLFIEHIGNVLQIHAVYRDHNKNSSTKKFMQNHFHQVDLHCLIIIQCDCECHFVWWKIRNQSVHELIKEAIHQPSVYGPDCLLVNGTACKAMEERALSWRQSSKEYIKYTLEEPKQELHVPCALINV